MWTARVFTLYPEIFPGPLTKGLYGKALKKKLWNLEVINIRASAEDKHSFGALDVALEVANLLEVVHVEEDRERRCRRVHLRHALALAPGGWRGDHGPREEVLQPHLEHAHHVAARRRVGEDAQRKVLDGELVVAVRGGDEGHRWWWL